jgi:hypothetical protein
MGSKAVGQKVKFKMLLVLQMFTILDSFREGKRLNVRLVIKEFTCLFLLLAAVMMPLSFLPDVGAAMSVSALNPSSGNVGTSVQVLSNLTTANGTYQVLFDDSIVANGTASDTSVNASFVVPETFGGNHTATVVDVTTRDNASRTFTVTTFYSLRVVVPESPRQLQEGDSAAIWANVTGGDASRTYAANVTVVSPNNESFVKMVDIVTSSLGTGSASVSYPDGFSGAKTWLVGNYGASFNDTLATGAFYVGLTNTTEYHRLQPVDVKAVYKPNENVTLTITGKDVYSSFNLTADPTGIVHSADFVIPSNASIGSYMVSIVSTSAEPTLKNPADAQNFTVPGFAVDVTAKNLAGDTVQTVEVKAFENGTAAGIVVTNASGVAVLRLELGTFTLEGYYKTQKVGAHDNFEVTGPSTMDLPCNLTNIRMTVVAIADGNQLGIPEAEVYLTPENRSFTTDITGNVVAHSLLPNVSYTLNVSRHSTPFNFTVIPQLLAEDGTSVPWVNVTFVCPAYSLRVQVYKGDGQPLGSVVVKIQESLGGLYSQGNTNENGIVTFDSALGVYAVAVYDGSGLKLNETSVQLFQDQNVTLICSLYGLTVTVKVTDYFGQGLANVNVTLQRQGVGPLSKSTQGDGTATFNNVVGGEFQIAVYMGDQTDPMAAVEQTIGSSMTVQIKLDRFVSLGGLLVDTSQFAIAILTVLTVMLVVVLEICRLRRARHQKVESQSSNKEP